ncbi:amino acid adenylation domain-containing protein [Pleurocapsales cyanobacterium LEGE 06147]|nr:amino acid adenylation domain-containing protein [Pleurocapsales cyanobacterium LEGE 06147]
MDNYLTIIELLLYRASCHSQKLAFSFLEDGETETATLTYEELDQQARAIATQLQIFGLRGERALLLYPPGLDYIAAFFGCLYAGVVAVPAYPPRNVRNTPRILSVLADAKAVIALTTTKTLVTIKPLFSSQTNSKELQWLTTDNITLGIEDFWQQPSIDVNTLAFLQYTSGSTGTPKGVMLSHGNLLHNAAMTYQMMEHSDESRFVSWLPMYHDMGLIGGILQPLYGGFSCFLMPPSAFLQRPYRWLQAISRFKGTTSGGPNFAYELCVQKVTSEQLETLDLSSWNVAFNGAEPIQHDTLKRFCAKFASCRFSPEAFYPCYGMAEATLMISGGNKKNRYKSQTVEKSSLAKNKIVEANDREKNIQTFISCGKTLPGQKIVIVNPETFTRCQQREVGEIWVSGNSVGKGYWNNQEATQQTFLAQLKDTQDFYLRTGDLGFLLNGELYITGRIKDVIIIRGRNLYPQDIELTAEKSHPALRLSSNAAFTVEIDKKERLVIVQELEFRAKPNLEEVTTAIRQAVTEAHEIEVYAVILIKPGSIPKTSSGKIQRRATRNKFLEDKLKIVAKSVLETKEFVDPETKLTRKELLQLSPQQSQFFLESYLQLKVARILKISSQDINLDNPLTTLGLDSLKVFELKNQLETDLEVSIAIADLFAGLTTRELVTKILAQLETTSFTESISLKKIATDNNIHPVSFAQARLWFLDRLKTGNTAYNISFGVRIQGNLPIEVLGKSIDRIVQRHEVLRTSFSHSENQPRQAIDPNVKLSLKIINCQQFPREKRELEAKRIATQEHQKPFNLTKAPLLRATLLCLEPEEHLLLLNVHHIIFDGRSAEVFIDELGNFYKLFLDDKTPSISELPIQYQDFVYWQKQWLRPEILSQQLDYWKQKLKDAPTILQLPTDKPRPPIQTYRGASQSLVLPKLLNKQLTNLSCREGVTRFMLLLAAFKILLMRHTGQEDIVVGSPIDNRNHEKLKGLVGFFVNMIALRTNLAGNPSFRELLSQIRQVAIEAYTHQNLPFEKLIEALQPERNLSYTPLFQVMFAVRNAPKLPKIDELNLSQYRVETETAQFDLNVSVEEEEEKLTVTFEYNQDLFDSTTIAHMLNRFESLLQGIVTNPDAKLLDLPYLSPTEEKQLLLEWNDTKTDYPQELCFHQLLEAQVTKTPDAIALVFEDRSITYFELNRRADRLANYLKNLGVKPDAIIGVCLERSIEMVVGLLAILKAGGAYLPLDCSYPQERLAFMIEDANISILLTQKHLQKALPAYQGKIICLDSKDSWSIDCNQTTSGSKIKPDNLAYVIYTSGSTGTPKGVVNTHRGLVNRLLWMQEAYQLTAKDRVLQKTPYSFDVSVWEFFWPLLTGATLVLAKPGGHQDSAYLVNLIANEQITTVHFVPSMLQVFLEEPELDKCSSLKRVICSGEPLTFTLQEKFFARLNCELYNLYGPTEAAIDVTHWRCQRGSDRSVVPIGRPIANTQIYILDRHLQPSPIGVPGELHIGGVGLARGYLNRPELTTEKFIENPIPPLLKGGDRLYKTGDLARYLPDGTIEYLGRIDHQIKLRGFRIELGEIEAVLTKHPDVREVVVLARGETPKHKQLVAYVVPHRDAAALATRDRELNGNELKNYLKNLLPEYMVPSAFLSVEKLPLLPNGKINRRALPIPQGVDSKLTLADRAPNSELERTIASIWQEVLPLEKVSRNDNFFDLGGHSLLMLQVNQKLRNSLQRDLSIVEMFQNPTIASLAQYLTLNSDEETAFKSIRDRTRQRIEAANRQKKARQKV